MHRFQVVFQSGESLGDLCGHTHKISYAAFSRDSMYLASCSWDRSVRIWNVSTSECRLILLGHDAGVHLVQWSCSDKLLASASNDMSIRIWDTVAGDCIHVLEQQLSVPWSLLWVGADNRLASGHRDGSIVVWDSKVGSFQKVFNRNDLEDEHNRCEVIALASSQDGSRLVYGCEVISLACSQDGSRLIYGSRNHNAYICSLSTFACTHRLVGHEHGVTNVLWSRDGGRVLSRCSGSIRIWNSDSGSCLQIIRGADSIPDYFSPFEISAIVRDFSFSTSPCAPVGIPCRNVTVFGNIACACFGNSGVVKFFLLKGARMKTGQIAAGFAESQQSRRCAEGGGGI